MKLENFKLVEVLLMAKRWFFIEYDPIKVNNTINELNFFKNDSLISSAKYDENGRIRR